MTETLSNVPTWAGLPKAQHVPPCELVKHLFILIANLWLKRGYNTVLNSYCYISLQQWCD